MIDAMPHDAPDDDWSDAEIRAHIERRASDPAYLRRVAFHEASHTVMLRVLKLNRPLPSLDENGEYDRDSDYWVSMVPGKEYDGRSAPGSGWITRGYKPDPNRMYYRRTAGWDAYENQLHDVSSHAKIIMLAAGYEAEIALCGADPNGRFGDQGDREEIEKLAAETWKPTRVDRLRRAARHLVIRHRRLIETVAERLLEVGTLRGAEIDEIIRRSSGA